MNSRLKYSGILAVLLLTVLLLGGKQKHMTERAEQHNTFNVHVEDTGLSVAAEDFASHLPVVHIMTNGGTIPGKPEEGQNPNTIPTTYLHARMQLFQQEGQLNTLHQEADFESDIQIRVRGNSSRRFDKSGYIFHFIDAEMEKQKFAVMGMERDSTWVLHGPFLDKTLMRNYMWYNLSGRLMDWAPDVRYCEVFLDNQYQGVYVMTEQIEIGTGRLDITKYDDRMPVCSYMLRLDRPSVNESIRVENFTRYSMRMEQIAEVIYPGESKITPAAIEYINKDFSQFEKTLYSYDHNSGRYGYQAYIDVDSFVDYFIINEVSQNADAGSLSTYIYKDIAGKYKMCVWDFNNCTDNYIEQRHSTSGFFMGNRIWFEMLLRDEAFVEKIIIRYRELRRGILSDPSVDSYISDVQAYLGSAVDRNFQVWGYTFLPQYNLLEGEGREITSYEDAIRQYRTSLMERLQWMDEHIEELRSFTHESINKKYNH